jgi:hypothetical protein
MTRRRLPWFLSPVMPILVLAGCSRSPDDSSARASAVLPPSPNDRVWQGVFPCSDCRGIETRLVLRAAAERRDYVLSESYLGEQTRLDVDQSGAWKEIVPPTAVAGAVTLVLLSPGEPGERRFALLEDGSLELLDGDGSRLRDGLAYRLPRR